MLSKRISKVQTLVVEKSQELETYAGGAEAESSKWRPRKDDDVWISVSVRKGQGKLRREGVSELAGYQIQDLDDKEDGMVTSQIQAWKQRQITA